jgi:hypothetical protein
LQSPPDELLPTVLAAAEEQLAVHREGPLEYLNAIVSWLEAEHRVGRLHRSYTTATIAVAISRHEVWTWFVCPHGVMHGSPGGMRFAGTDLRFPVLRELGVMPESPVRLPGIDASDRASSICCIGTPLGYETLRLRLAPAELVLLLDRGSLPFGPLPAEPVPVESLWSMDAAWLQGLGGRVVALGSVEAADLRVPPEWEVREVPLG